MLEYARSHCGVFYKVIGASSGEMSRVGSYSCSQLKDVKLCTMDPIILE